MSSEPIATTRPPTSRLRLLDRPVVQPLLQRYDVAGVPVDAMSFEGAIQRLLAAPRLRQRLSVHFCALHTFVEASRDATMRRVLAAADIVAPDGMPVVWLGKLKGKNVERVCGPDTMPAILDRARSQGARHFFYGATPSTLGSLAAAMTERFPGLQVAGLYAPPFRPLTADEKMRVIEMINGADPDYVWVGIGSPKQDHWLAEFRPLLNAPVLLAVGAAFDFHAGCKKRAPLWAQHWGVEWMFRLASEPRRLMGRYALAAAVFARILLFPFAATQREVKSDNQW